MGLYIRAIHPSPRKPTRPRYFESANLSLNFSDRDFLPFCCRIAWRLELFVESWGHASGLEVRSEVPIGLCLHTEDVGRLAALAARQERGLTPLRLSPRGAPRSPHARLSEEELGGGGGEARSARSTGLGGVRIATGCTTAPSAVPTACCDLRLATYVLRAPTTTATTTTTTTHGASPSPRRRSRRTEDDDARRPTTTTTT
jgi:hypothetical protein